MNDRAIESLLVLRFACACGALVVGREGVIREIGRDEESLNTDFLSFPESSFLRLENAE